MTLGRVHDALDQRSPLTFKDVLSHTELPSANRYVQVALIVTLAGRSRAYNHYFSSTPKGTPVRSIRLSDRVL